MDKWVARFDTSTDSSSTKVVVQVHNLIIMLASRAGEALQNDSGLGISFATLDSVAADGCLCYWKHLCHLLSVLHKPIAFQCSKSWFVFDITISD